MLNPLAFSMVCAAAFAFAACTAPHQQVQAGEDQSVLVARLGPPKETYDLPNGSKRLMWPTQPMGTTTTAADVDASGKVVAIRQVLQDSEFHRAEVDKWTRDDVLVNFGRPFESGYFKRTNQEIWSYRYVANNVDHLLYHFYFDDQGVLRHTQRAPDPDYELGGRGRF